MTTNILAIGIKGKKTLRSIADLAEASRIVDEMRMRHMQAGKGPNSFPRVLVYDVSGEPTPIGRASWNGRIWPMGEWESGQKPLTDADIPTLHPITNRPKPLDKEAWK